ncbi:MAG: PilW family protein [Pseudomonadota bacterium]
MNNVMGKQRGVTLIELMIAILIGIFISLMVVQYLATSSRMFKRQGVDSNIEQNASFAVSYLSKYIRQAGSRDGHGTEIPFYSGDCGAFSPCTAEADGADGTEPNSDRVAVQMFVGAGGRDCAGNPANGQIANVFYIDEETTGSGVSSLFCRGFDVATNSWIGTNGTALIDGVEQMQVIYGVADASEQIYSYLSSDRIPAVAGSMAHGWDRIRAVNVALLVSDGYGSATEIVANRNFQLFDGPPTNFNDGINRRVFSTAITVNSKIP